MIQKHFDAIDKVDIDMLIANAVNESKTLEYKQKLPGDSNDDRKEVLHDVSSFGNASGGDILFGVKAALDGDGKKTGAPECVIPITGETADEAKLRIENLIRDCIDPRLPVQIKEISGWGENGDGFIILIRIPRSFASPHMVTFKGASRFFSRNSAGKYPLDVHEIRTAFLATESQADRIRRFRQDRLAKIVSDETPVVLSSPHRLVLHMIPVASFLNQNRLDLSDQHSLTTTFPPIYRSGWSKRYNLDGFVTFSGERQPGSGHDGYCQLFFDGALESVYSDVLRQHGGERVNGGIGFIASVAYEKYLIEAVKSYSKGYKQLNLLPPVVISVALLGCKGSLMYTRDPFFSDEYHPIDRDTALLPDILIDSLDIDVPQVMKPIFDAVWNACGFSRSLNYDQDGKWNPR